MASVLVGHRPAREGHARFRDPDDLLPARSLWKVAVVETSPVELQNQTVLQGLDLPGSVSTHARMIRVRDDARVLDFLKGRDLGEVDHISELDRVSAHPDGRVLADAEV